MHWWYCISTITISNLYGFHHRIPIFADSKLCTNMPPFIEQLKKEDDVWHLVNFIQSLWPEELQPELVEKAPQEDKEETGEGN